MRIKDKAGDRSYGNGERERQREKEREREICCKLLIHTTVGTHQASKPQDPSVNCQESRQALSGLVLGRISSSLEKFQFCT